MNTEDKRDIEKRSSQFALRIGRLCKSLASKAGVSRTLNNQLLRSGTSVGVNVEDAHSAQSRPDFIHKMSIAFIEARETRYWLRLIIDAELVADNLLRPLLEESTEIMRILGAIVSTCRKRQPPIL